MKSNPIIPSVQKALDYILLNIHDGMWRSNGVKLPSIKELSVEAGIGYVGMVTAIKILQKRKVLISKRSAGTFVGQHIPQKNKMTSVKIKTYKWQLIREKIKYDIFEGQFHESEFLPNLKQLEAIYAASFPVLTTALHSLSHEDLISDDKRRYRIRRSSVPQVINTICIIGDKRHFSLSLWLSLRSWLELFMHSIEKECLVRNVKLTRILFSRESSLSMGNTDNTLGFIFWHYDYEEEDDKVLFSIIKTLLPQKKPIVIIFSDQMRFEEETKNQLIDLAAKHHYLYLIKYPDNVSAGYQVGRFLIDRGYSMVGYFYPQFAKWTIDRLHGLTKAFTSMGYGNGVVSFPVSLEEQQNSSPAVTCTKDVELLKNINEKFAFLDCVRDMFNREKKRLPFFEVEDQYIQQIFETQNGILFRRSFQSKFREALAIKGRIAWVCADDYIANSAALPFLTSEKIKIPEQIGLVGFNDHVESLIHGVTSYNFNFQGMALRALNFILYPNDKQWKKDRKDSPDVSIKGMVIDRGSV